MISFAPVKEKIILFSKITPMTVHKRAIGKRIITVEEKTSIKLGQNPSVSINA